MSEILLINPVKRRRNRKGRFVKGPARKRRASPRRRRRNPNGTYTPSGAHPAGALINPKRRRRSYRSVARRVSRKRRRNPRMRAPMGGIVAQLMPAVMGATGAVATDLAFRFIPTPGPLAMLKGQLAPVTRIALAFGVSTVAGFMVSRKAAGEMLSGALTVIAYGLMNQYVLSRLPVVGVGEYISDGGYMGYNDAGQSFDPNVDTLPDPGMLDYANNEENVGEYISM